MITRPLKDFAPYCAFCGGDSTADRPGVCAECNGVYEHAFTAASEETYRAGYAACTADVVALFEKADADYDYILWALKNERHVGLARELP